ncbi:MAG: ECF-type sigma factor [Planctomycetota bacterium]|jgi:RNA polymerase sigma factor (TIGR02999 family)
MPDTESRPSSAGSGESAGDDFTPSAADDQLFERLREGDPAAAGELFREVYAQLHGLARQRMSQQPIGHTLQPTALISEAYLRLDRGKHRIRDRRHFLCLASMAMRQILVDHAKRANASKRPGRGQRVDHEGLLDGLAGEFEARAQGLEDLDLALEKLEAVDPDLARLVELHFFGGQTMEDSAAALGISQRQAFRWWKSARAFLYRELRSGEGSAGA